MASPARSHLPSTPTAFPSTPRLVHGTPEPGLLTRRIRCADFTARAVFSDTSGPNETAALTLPSFKSKELVQKKRLNSTSERFVVPPRIFRLANLVLSACSIRLQGQEGAPGVKSPSYLGVRVPPYTSAPLSRFLTCESQSSHPPSRKHWCCKGKIQEQPPTTRLWRQCSCGTSDCTFSPRNHSYDVGCRCCTPLPFDCIIQSSFPLFSFVHASSKNKI